MARKLNSLTPTAETIKALENCAKLLKQAQAALNPITRDMTNWGSYDALDLKSQISQMLSCDEGEAGLEALIDLAKGKARK